MNLLSLIPIGSLLLLITLGALYSELGGSLALFLDGLINFSAFLCYTFLRATGSAVLASFISCAICLVLVFASERACHKFNADSFLVSLALNLFFSAAASFISSLAFGTRGVLYAGDLILNAKTVRLVTTILCTAFSIALILILVFTPSGLRLRITGTSPEVLRSQGFSPAWYRCASWLCAAFTASFAGCVLCLRFSSFVPGIASGRGWTAIAAVFLARRNPLLVIPAVLVFAFAEYAGSYIQNVPQFANVSSGLLLSLPYLLALLVMAFSTRSKSE